RYVAAQQLFNQTGEENDDLREWRELNTRWYQFGCFAPLFRAHGQWPFREVFNIAPENHPAYKSIVAYTKLRYNLMPYIYSLAGMTHFNDYTIMRPLVMDYTADLATRNIHDQFMFGPSIMAAPVYKYGARSRLVYLPAGQWYDFHTGKTIDAGKGKTITADAPYEHMPLFVRSGAIIPMGADIQSTAEETQQPVTLLVYAGADGKFSLYEDEGTNYNYEKGLFSRIDISYDDKSSTLTIAPRHGSYPGMKETRNFNVVRINPENPAAASHSLPGKLVAYNGSEVKVNLK
ncbi:MAG: DUF5110 domain-containing protein, partial [Muribaculaceae bacterium]|nr:DUF5110 domain-containing protein [Muribaculaceae bacterium]